MISHWARRTHTTLNCINAIPSILELTLKEQLIYQFKFDCHSLIEMQNQLLPAGYQPVSIISDLMWIDLEQANQLLVKRKQQ